MRVWSNTNTLDGLLPGVDFTQEPALADVALVGGKRFTLEDFPRLRAIFKTGVGRDNIPEEEAARRSIRCEFPSRRTCDVIFDETAAFAVHLIFRSLYAEVGDFNTWAKRRRTALEARTLLVLGTGNIGRRVAERMSPFMKVETYDQRTHDAGQLEPLIRAADCVTLHIPLTDQTRNLFDRKKLAWLRDGASLVNTARAAIVDEDALYQELASGRLRAAFDVFWKEPYQGQLLELPADRFMVSPHVASACREFLELTACDFLQMLKELEEQ